jgi:hypothetical protein
VIQLLYRHVSAMLQSTQSMNSWLGYGTDPQK